MKRFLSVSAAAATLMAAGSSAHAQLGSSFNNATFAGRLGIYRPFDDGLTTLSDIWFAAGFDVEFPIGLFKGATTVLSFDWFSHNGGARDNIFPITLNQRFGSGQEGRNMYFQVGIGLAVLDLSPSDNVFCLRGGIGMNFTEKFFVEGNVYWTEEPTSNPAGSGFAVFAGLKF